LTAVSCRDRRVQTVTAIREAKTSARPVREYLQALDASNPAHEGGAKYLSPTDPAAAWNTKEGRGRFGYFNNYLVDTDHAIIVDVEATLARIAQEIKATKSVERCHSQRSMGISAGQRQRLACSFSDTIVDGAPHFAATENLRQLFVDSIQSLP
jgi:hypothetical protein